MSMSRFCAAVALLALPGSVLFCGSSSSGPGTGAGAGDSGTGQPGNGDSGSGQNPGEDSGGGNPSPDGGSFKEGAFPRFPTVTNHGVPVLATPKIVAVTFNNDTNAQAIGSFVSSVGSTTWWTAVTKDYGVGAPTGSSVALTATLEASYTDDPSGKLADGGAPTMPAFVASTVTTGAGMPKPDANTIYVFYLPSTTTVSIGGGTTCVDTGGYHSSTTSGGATILYAIIPECAGGSLAGRAFGSEADLLTFASSHEILEAATDPTATFTATGMTAGWYNDLIDDPQDDLAWNELGDGEIADFCVDQFAFSGSYHDTATAGTNTVQRIWSTSAASVGANPCVPVPSGEVYFNAGPAEGSDLVIGAQGTATTVTVDAFSDGPRGSWSVVALDGAIAQGKAAQMTLSFIGGAPETEPFKGLTSLPGATVSNNTTTQLSVTLTAALDANTNPFAVGILISHDGTNLGTATTDHYWPFIVTTQAIATQVGLMPQFRHHVQEEIGRTLRALREK
jgi:hypothetical protein